MSAGDNPCVTEDAELKAALEDSDWGDDDEDCGQSKACEAPPSCAAGCVVAQAVDDAQASREAKRAREDRGAPVPAALEPPQGLSCLPREVLLRVLSFLSALDLTTCSRCGSQLRQLCGEDVLWRRLFCSRLVAVGFLPPPPPHHPVQPSFNLASPTPSHQVGQACTHARGLKLEGRFSGGIVCVYA